MVEGGGADKRERRWRWTAPAAAAPRPRQIDSSDVRSVIPFVSRWFEELGERSLNRKDVVERGYVQMSSRLICAC